MLTSRSERAAPSVLSGTRKAGPFFIEHSASNFGSKGHCRSKSVSPRCTAPCTAPSSLPPRHARSLTCPDGFRRRPVDEPAAGSPVTRAEGSEAVKRRAPLAAQGTARRGSGVNNTVMFAESGEARSSAAAGVWATLERCGCRPADSGCPGIKLGMTTVAPYGESAHSYWLLATGCWLLPTGFCLLVTGSGPVATAY